MEGDLIYAIVLFTALIVTCLVLVIWIIESYQRIRDMEKEEEIREKEKSQRGDGK